MGWIYSRLFGFSFSKILPPLKVHFLGLLSTKNVYWAGWDAGRVKTKISRVWERTTHWKPSPDGVSWEDTQDLKSSVLLSQRPRAGRTVSRSLTWELGCASYFLTLWQSAQRGTRLFGLTVPEDSLHGGCAPEQKDVAAAICSGGVMGSRGPERDLWRDQGRTELWRHALPHLLFPARFHLPKRPEPPVLPSVEGHVYKPVSPRGNISDSNLPTD